MQISIFKDVRDVSNPYHRTVDYALNRIKEGKSRKLVEQYRSTKDDKFKRALPGYCFAGTFSHRSASGLIQHSGLIVLDFDDVQNLPNFKRSVSELPFVLSAFISPSNNGLKCVVKIPPEPEKHEGYFRALQDAFDQPLDPSGKDVSRFCFESYDPEIYINLDAEVWTSYAEPEQHNVGSVREEVVVPLTSEAQIIDRLQKWFDSKYGMSQGQRNENLFKFAAALSDFGIPQRVAESHLAQYAASDFSVNEINRTIRSAYTRGRANFGTQCFEDTEKRRELEREIRSGKKNTEIKRQLREEQSPIANEADKVIDSIKSTMEVDEFWYYNDKGKINLSPHKFKFFLEGHNFMKYYPTDSDTFTFIQKSGNLIEETNEDRIKDFVLDYLLKRDDIGFGPYDFIANRTSTFSLQFLSMLKSANIEIQSDTPTEAYLYYQNCAVRVTRNEVEEIDYLDLPGYVWRKQVIQRDYHPTDHHPSEFRTFLWKIAGEDKERYNSFKSIIGYFLHSYKTSSKNKAVILNDETISENPNGGSGKGLFWNALAKMKKVSMIDGKTFDFNKSFPYQTVSTDCQILVFDDVKKNFSFESLFSVITEGITIEYKGQDAVHLPVERSPKILITTNYTVGGSGGSHERRKFEAELSSHFNTDHTPEDEFGHMLFDDWDDMEWRRFDAFMINCLQGYLETGLVAHEWTNLETRKFIKTTSPEWYDYTKAHDWCEVGERIPKKAAYDKFIEDYPDLRKWLSQRKFKSWVEAYCKFYELDYKELNTQGTRYFVIGEEKEMPF